jgi:hypothetical protein
VKYKDYSIVPLGAASDLKFGEYTTQLNRETLIQRKRNFAAPKNQLTVQLADD